MIMDVKLLNAKMVVLGFLMIVVLPKQVENVQPGYKDSESLNGRTYRSPGDVECLMCGPGEYVKSHCTSHLQHSICGVCPPDTFSNRASGATKCQDCKRCNRGVTTVHVCNSTIDTVCRCPEGHEPVEIDGEIIRCDVPKIRPTDKKEITTTPAPGNRTDCQNGSVWNSTSNRCEVENTRHTNNTRNDDRLTATNSKVIVIAVPIVTGIVIGIGIGIGILKWRKRHQPMKIYMHDIETGHVPDWSKRGVTYVPDDKPINHTSQVDIPKPDT